MNSIRCRAGAKKSGLKLILAVKDQENTIEGVIREIYGSGVLERTMGDGYLTVVDMGSKDDTLKILTRLQKRYQGLEITCCRDMESVLDEFQRLDAMSQQ